MQVLGQSGSILDASQQQRITKLVTSSLLISQSAYGFHLMGIF
jgi:hypothetical protein